MSNKQTKIIDLNLFSGSSEILRQIAGGYYRNLDNEGEISFFESSIVDNISGVESLEQTEINNDADTILPKIKYVSRVSSDEQQGFESDEDWKLFVIGGTYDSRKTYTGIYNDRVYADHYNMSPLPYVPREIVNIPDLTPSLTLTTEYYNYYPAYQSEVNRLESELQAPNFYFLNSSSYLVPSYNREIVQSKYQYSMLADYLSSSYVQSEKTIDSKMENIFVLSQTILNNNNGTRLDTADLLEHGEFDSDLSSLYSLMPFGNKLHIGTEITRPNNNTDYRDIIQNNLFQVKFIKLLKEIFQDESRLQPSTIDFAINTKAMSSTGLLTGSLESTTTMPVRLIDAPTMLLYSYRNPTSETNNISVVQSSSFVNEIDYAMDTTGIYRYENTTASLGVLNGFVETISRKFESAVGEGKINNLESLLNQARTSKYHETVAFRVEKIGGSPTGDSNTENTIQNIWFFNRSHADAFTYLDTQVKYNTEYTYKIYKYDVVQGYKYQLSDVVTTRQIASTSSGDSNVYCLEFYDPFTGQTTAPLFENVSTIAELQVEKNLLESDIDDKTSAGNAIMAILHSKKQSFIQSNYMHPGDSRLGGATGFRYNARDANTGAEILATPRFYEEFEKFYGMIFGKYSGGNYFKDTKHSSSFVNIKNYIDNDFSAPRGDIQHIIAQLDKVLSIANIELISLDDIYGTIQISVSDFIASILDEFENYEVLQDSIASTTARLQKVKSQILSITIGSGTLRSDAQINSSYPRLADFNVTIEPSLKIIEIPIEQKSMRIVDHPPNDFVVTPHHLLDQSNRLSFYCKYDTFSQDAVTYPPTLNASDTINKTSYLIGHDFVEISEQTQESVSRPRFLEVYRTTERPTGYGSFSGNLIKTIDLFQENGDIPTDYIYLNRVRENTTYYYAFRAVNENRVAGQMSSIIESELINDGGYVYGRFEQYSEQDMAVVDAKEPLLAFKKLINIKPNLQHVQLDTTNVNLDESSLTQIEEITLGSSNLLDPLFTDANRYFKIRLTSKKTGRKLDINIGFKKEVRK